MSKLINTLLFTAATGAFAFAAAESRACKGSVCKTQPDFLLILGCRVKGGEPEATLQMRIEAAAEYLTRHEDVLAICCGGIVHADQTKSEAQAIYNGLTALGIDKARLILEDRSKTTAENFINAKKIIDGMELTEPPKLAFLSSEFHLLRAGIIGKRAGVAAESIPAPSPKELRVKNYLRELAVFPMAFIGGSSHRRK